MLYWEPLILMRDSTPSYPRRRQHQNITETTHAHSLSLSISKALEKSRPTFTRLSELLYRSALSLQQRQFNDRAD